MGNKQQNKEKKQKAKISKKQVFLTILVMFVILLAFAGIGFRYWVVSNETVKRHIKSYKIEAFLTANKFNGEILVAQGDEVLFMKGYGKTDVANWDESKDIDSDTIFPIFSLTKQFTAYAILQLEQEGKLSRTDKLSKYFDNCRYGDEVTLEEMLNMVSGIPDFVGTLSDEEKVQGVERDEMLAKILNFELIEKGEFNYSNSNYYLLGCIIEQVSGLTYEQYIQDYVIEPSGMKQVRFGSQDGDTIGFIPDDDVSSDNQEYHTSITFSAGEICTSAINLYRWQRFLYSDESVMDFDSFKDYDYKYGLVKDYPRFSHSGGGLYHIHYMMYNTETKMQVIVLSNSKKCNAEKIAETMEKIISE